MDFNIPADVTAYLAELDAFIEKEIKPLERENDNIRFFDHRREWARTDFERDGLPRHEWEALLGEMRRRADKAGHYRYALPKEYGGKDGTNLAMAIIREYLAAKGLGLHNDLQNESSIVGNLPTVLMFRDFGNEQQKKEFIPKLLDGSMRIAFGLTEPNHGSDATWMETRGVRDGDHWRITGAKMWNTGLHVATHDFVFARTSGKDGSPRGITCFIVPTKSAGFKIEEYMWTFNMPTDHPRISLTDVRGAGRRDSRRSGERTGGGAAFRPRESHSPGREFAGRRAILHQREREVRQAAQALRQTALEQPGDSMAAGRAAHRSRDDPQSHPEDRVADGSDVEAGSRAQTLRQGRDVQLPREPAGLRRGGPRDAGAWRDRLFAAQAVRAHFPASSALSHHGRLGRNPDAARRAIPVRIFQGPQAGGGVGQARALDMSNEDFAARLQAAIARHVGAPGTIHDLQRLTGGANKTTWSFDADVAGTREQFILQLASTRANDESNPLAGVSPHLTADEDARLMIAAVKAGVPAPRVRAILKPDDGLGARLRH